VALCSRVAAYDGKGGWTTLADLSYQQPARRADAAEAPAEHVTVSPDGQDAWAYGREVWSSHDAGATWSRQHAGTGSTGVQQVVVAGDTAVLRTGDGRLLESPARTDAWAPLPSPPGTRFVTSVVALGDRLLVSGQAPDGLQTQAVSDDGGTHWRGTGRVCSGDAAPSPGVDAGAVAVCPGHTAMGTDSPGTLVYTSRDGVRWTLTVGIHLAQDAALDAVVPMDAHAVYAVTSRGALVLTPESELQLPSPVPAGESVLDGRFVTPQHGYLLVGLPRTLLETTDAGRTWRPIG
jgi:photosystem II stability/assembly factor-like uncharacterized protein